MMSELVALAANDTNVIWAASVFAFIATTAALVYALIRLEELPGSDNR
jgi:hypothetical protein